MTDQGFKAALCRLVRSEPYQMFDHIELKCNGCKNTVAVVYTHTYAHRGSGCCVASVLPGKRPATCDMNNAVQCVVGLLSLVGGVMAIDASRILMQAPIAHGQPDAEIVWHVTVGTGAPDCFQRDVILVNGSFQPTLVVRQGRYLQVS